MLGDKGIINDLVRSPLSGIVTPVVGVSLDGLIFHAPLISHLGAMGDAVGPTYARASSGTYVDPVDGLIKTAGNNTPRFESAGLLMEGQSTNWCLYSQSFDSPLWSCVNNNATPSNPVVTPNVAVAPDGTVTSDRIDFAVVEAGKYNVIYQTTGVSTPCTFSVWLRTLTGVATVWLESAFSGTYKNTRCNLTTIWQRFVLKNTIDGNFFLGVDNRDVTQTIQPAFSVLVWGAQVETSKVETSYIPTTSAPVTRAADSLSWPLSDAMKDALSNAVGGPTSEFTLMCDWTPAFVRANLAAVIEGILTVADDNIHGMFLRAAGDSLSLYDGWTEEWSPFTWAANATYRLAMRGSTARNKLLVSFVAGGSITNGVDAPYDGSMNPGSKLNVAYGITMPFHSKNLRLYNRWLTDQELRWC